MDHLLSREKESCAFCLVLNVRKETFKEDIENWIVMKEIRQKRKT